MDAGDPKLWDRLVGLRFQRDELARDIVDHQKLLGLGEPAITPEKIVRLSLPLKDKLYNGPSELKQAYARLMLNEVRVTDHEI